MKKLIYFLIAFVGISIIATAQDTYYYCSGEKIPLQVDSQRLVTISPITEARPVLTNGFELVDTVCDPKSDIRIYRYNHTAYTPSQARILARQANQPASAVQPCYIDETGMELAPDGYLYVKLKSLADSSLLNQVATQYQLEVIERDQFMPLWYTLRQLSSSTQSAVDVANGIYETGLFASASPDFSFNPFLVSYDSCAHLQWGLYNREYEDVDISVSSAWNYTTGKGIKIAIVDTGIDTTHQDLAANIYPLSYDAYMSSIPVSYPSTVYDPHGSHCAGIAAAVRNNGLDIAGVAPDAQLMSISIPKIRVTEATPFLCRGVDWAWRNGADVISCSWKCVYDDKAIEVIDSALVRGRGGKGCILVFAAGNSRGDVNFPANHRKEVLAIGNITENGTLADDSCFGDSLFAVAPGTHIWSTIPENRIGSMSGTSMAAPHVAGVAALILERNPNLTANQVREIIAKNAKKVGDKPYDTEKEFGSWNEYYGYGLVDAHKAVKNTPLITLTPLVPLNEDEDLETQ